MQKIKASGLNSISMYVHWHLTNPKKGVIDLEGINDLQTFFDAAKAEGLWVIARPDHTSSKLLAIFCIG